MNNVNSVKKYFINYINDILNGKRDKNSAIKEINIPSFKTIKPQDRFEIVKQSIIEHPQNLFYYLEMHDFANLRDKIVDYFIKEEIAKLVELTCQNQEILPLLPFDIIHCFNFEQLIKISKSLLNNISNYNISNMEPLDAFMGACSNSKYVSDLKINENFYPLAQKFIQVNHIFYGSLMGSMSLDKIRNYESQIIYCVKKLAGFRYYEKQLESNANNQDVLPVSFNLNLGYYRDAFNYLAFILDNISPKFSEFVALHYFDTVDCILHMEGSKFLAGCVTRKMASDGYLKLFCDQVVKSNQLDVLLTKGYMHYFSGSSEDFIFTYFQDEIINEYFLKMPYHIQFFFVTYLDEKTLVTLFQKLINEHGLDKVKNFMALDCLQEKNKKQDKLYASLKAELEALARKSIYEKSFDKFIASTNKHLLKKLLPNIIDDLIRFTLETKDTYLFVTDSEKGFSRVALKKLFDSLKDLLIKNSAYVNLWNGLKKYYSKEDILNIYNNLLDSERYEEAYLLAKNELEKNKVVEVYAKLLATIKANPEKINLASRSMLRRLDANNTLKVFRIIENYNLDLFPTKVLTDNQLKTIKQEILKNIENYTFEELIKYARKFEFKTTNEVILITKIIDYWYENYFPDMNVLSDVQNINERRIASLASKHKKILLNYMFTAKRDEVLKVANIINGDPDIKKLYKLINSETYSLKDYNIVDRLDYIKLYLIYITSKMSLEEFSLKYGISSLESFKSYNDVLDLIDRNLLLDLITLPTPTLKDTWRLVKHECLNISDYFANKTIDFKNQNIEVVLNSCGTKETKNYFIKKFIDYVLGLSSSYLPVNVLEFLSVSGKDNQEVLDLYVKTNIENDTEYLSKYQIISDFIRKNSSGYNRSYLYGNLTINDKTYEINDEILDNAYFYLRSKGYCISNYSLEKAIKEIIEGKISLDRKTASDEGSTGISIDQITKNHCTLEEYLKGNHVLKLNKKN